MFPELDLSFKYRIKNVRRVSPPLRIKILRLSRGIYRGKILQITYHFSLLKISYVLSSKNILISVIFLTGLSTYLIS